MAKNSPDNSNKQINVLHFRYGFKLGGVENFILSIIENITDNVKHHIVIFKDIVDPSLIDKLEDLNCKVHIIRTKDTKNPLTIFELLKIIRENKINLVHSHDPGGVKWISLCKLFIPKLKLIFTVHDTDIINNLDSAGIFLLRKFVDKNIAISKSILSEYKSRSVFNTELIYNGINIKRFDSLNKTVNFDLESLKIVNLAWLWLPKKGQDVLIKALSICKDKGIKLSCDFVGGIHDKQSNDCIKKLVKENDIEDIVYFLGAKADIPSLLKDYNLFIFPSRYEGLPLSLLEALAAGLPVISSNINGSNELIENENNGLLFENENYQDLADKIEVLYVNRDKMKKIAENGFNFVQNFDISVMSKKYLDVYKEVVEDKNG